MKEHKILVTGACSQLGLELTKALRERYGEENVIAADTFARVKGMANYMQVDVMSYDFLDLVIRECGIKEVYHFACTHAGEEDNGSQVTNLPLSTWLQG